MEAPLGGAATPVDWIGLVPGIEDPTERRALIEREGSAGGSASVERLHAEVLRLIYVDAVKAERLAEAAGWLAEMVGGDYARALGERCAGHMHYVRGEHAAALDRYERAVKLLAPLGLEIEVGRTLLSGIQPLIYLSRNEDALEWAGRAREIFTRHGDRLRLARLASNTGNILYRQDRYAEAMASYREARLEMERSGEPRDVAAVLNNMAVCSISLNDFAGALRIYDEARAFCETHGLAALVAAADYNIAYLHYLRGEYLRATELYRAARLHCAEVGDAYHLALCDLDESEMCLELNLSAEGGRLAREAAAGFAKLGMGYEHAKAIANEALAQSHREDFRRALRLFREARRRFVAEKNAVWPALIDLYEAVILHRVHRNAEAERACRKAYRALRGSPLEGRAALCELLLARIAREAGDPAGARRNVRAAMDRFERTEIRSLRFLASFILGQIEEDAGQPEAARAAYEKARREIEDLRGGLWAEQLKIAFLSDKLAVYENLVWLCLERRGEDGALEEAFALIEQAKSRVLADLLASPDSMPASGGAAGGASSTTDVRSELNACYRQIEAAAVENSRNSENRIASLRRRAREWEAELVRAMNGPGGERRSRAIDGGGVRSMEEIRRAIPDDATLVQYFRIRDVFYAGLLGRRSWDIVPLAPVAEVRELHRLLQFQMSKFRLDASYLRAFEGSLLRAVNSHLKGIYGSLVAPLRTRLETGRLIIAPHGILHDVPFHALSDGRDYLIDSFAISYIPSGSVFALCQSRLARFGPDSLVLGVGTPDAPHIVKEARQVAEAIPNARLALGADATEQLLREYAPASRFLHIATHGLFRRDNPMFSSIRLGDGWFSLYDLYRLPLTAELVTLSGCSTGVNVVTGADELLGLLRGLLQAGASAMLLTLWDVNDASTAEFMGSFYRALPEEPDMALALRKTIQAHRDKYPHPYFWAPFVIAGRTELYDQ